MHRRNAGPRVALGLQAVYSVATLADVAGVSRHLLLRVLRSNGLKLIQNGRALLVPLTEIQRKIPPLWESLVLAEKTRGAARV